MPPPAAGEEIDGRDHERQEGRDQDELDRPAANHAGAEIDVARRPLHELRTLVERSQKLLRAASDLRQAPAFDPLRRVGESNGAPVARGRQRHRAQAASEDGALFVERERKGEVEQLGESPRRSGQRPRLFLHAGGSCLDQAGRCLPRGDTADHQARSCLAGDRVEDDRGHDPVAIVQGEAFGAETAELAAVGRNEEKRVRGADDARARRGVSRDRARIGARQLDECGDARGVVVRSRPRADVVEMRQHGQGLRRASGNGDDQVLELDAPAPRDLR